MFAVSEKEKKYKDIWVKGRIRSCRFLRIFTYTDDGLFQVRLGYMSVNEYPVGLKN